MKLGLAYIKLFTIRQNIW